MLEAVFGQRTKGTVPPYAREILQGVTAAGMPAYRESMHDITAELRRCRRYEHPLAMLVTRMDVPAASAAAAEERSLECMLFLLFGSMLRDVTRESDLVTYAADEHSYALFLPETGAVAAERAARRIAHAFYIRTNRRIRTSIAEFPSHGLTMDALFDHAVRALEHAALTPVDTVEPVREAVQCEIAGSAS